MNVKKPLLVTGALAVVGVTGLTGLGVASAATNSTSDDPKSSLIDKIATKFNLNKADVEAVFEEERAEHEAEMQQRMEDKLSQAVADGEITEEQKDKIIAKLKELKTQMEANHEAMEGKTDEERRAFMEQQHEALQKWAEANDIPMEYLHFKVMHKHGPVGPEAEGGLFIERHEFGEHTN